ncbi:AraC family transcriptional regulator [Aquimarina algicola]|uniref:AraC family transcriptional regulator n=1 Tax=Aquimarina algicola TaxID=2589995 RepID=A0A504J5X8_9FLAO|nr:AraC family transcriptional regulator [Aquimarina algicola]TPN83358.1 AraC family transcriptional regulator [Aquimarina algicola]
MNNPTHLDRYKKLLSLLDKRFKEEITVQEIEDTVFYSYRNINRIFLALHQETIGHYQKRLRLEKAAEYLKFSNQPIADIALDIGYNEISSFSKAFKKHFNCSPTIFRNSHEFKQSIIQESIKEIDINTIDTPSFTIEKLPDLRVLYLTYYGNYDNIKAIENTWEQLSIYALKKKILHERTVFLGEILDDEEITDSINCRYNAAILLDDNVNIETKGLFNIKVIKEQKYAKFIHKGSHESSYDTYHKIYTHWLTKIQLELADQPTIEFYINDESDTPKDELITEIYIPIV